MDPHSIQYTPGNHLGGSPQLLIHSRDPPGWFPLDPWSVLDSVGIHLDPGSVLDSVGVNLGATLVRAGRSGDPRRWFPGVYWMQRGSTDMDPWSVLDSVPILLGGSLGGSQECRDPSGSPLLPIHTRDPPGWLPTESNTLDPPPWFPGVYWIQWGST